MPVLTWDRVEDRVYESGLDRGVLYLPDSSAVVWNGLTSVIEQSERKVDPVFFDGQLVNNLVTVGAFKATMRAVTYPDEFMELEGLDEMKNGVYVGEQKPQTFGLCYRTRVGNTDGFDAVGYKIHILYNVIAIPAEKNYVSASNDPALTEFEWELLAIPQGVAGHHPSSHFMIDSTQIDPWMLEDIEDILYGSEIADASLIPLDDLVDFINTWFRIQIIDHLDGTWSAIEHRPGFITVYGDNEFQIVEADAQYIDDFTYIITDTLGLASNVEVSIFDNGDGTFTVSTPYDNIIVPLGDELVEIRNATIVVINATTFQLTDTIAE